MNEVHNQLSPPILPRRLALVIVIAILLCSGLFLSYRESISNPLPSTSSQIISSSSSSILSSPTPSSLCGISLAKFLGFNGFRVLNQSVRPAFPRLPTEQNIFFVLSVLAEVEIILTESSSSLLLSPETLFFTARCTHNEFISGAIGRPYRVQQKNETSKIDKTHQRHHHYSYYYRFDIPLPPRKKQDHDHDYKNVETEITLSWIGDTFLGSKWDLPPKRYFDDDDDDDNRNNKNNRHHHFHFRDAIYAQRCINLTLQNPECGRFGVRVFHSTEINLPALSGDANTRRRKSASSDEQDSNQDYLVSSDKLSSQGVWRKVVAYDKHRLLLDDYVGLNRFRGAIWKWEPWLYTTASSSSSSSSASRLQQTSFKWFYNNNNDQHTSDHTSLLLLKFLQENQIQNITLFGDSMILEQFNFLIKKLMMPLGEARDVAQNDDQGRNKNKKLRILTRSFLSSNSTIRRICVTFIQTYNKLADDSSYNKNDGNTSTFHHQKYASSIIDPVTVAQEILKTRPQIVIGNAALFHHLQNTSRTEKDFRSYLQELISNLLRLSENDTSNKNIFRKFIFLGPTMIHMGRRQGLSPIRTLRFAQVAREEIIMKKKTKFFEYLEPFNMSISRREAFHDGLHSACYRMWGGVTEMINQMILNVVID